MCSAAKRSRGAIKAIHGWTRTPSAGFYIVAFVFVVLPYLVMKIKTLNHRLGEGGRAEAIPGRALSILTVDC